MTTSEKNVKCAEIMGMVRYRTQDEYERLMRIWEKEEPHPHSSLTKPAMMEIDPMAMNYLSGPSPAITLVDWLLANHFHFACFKNPGEEWLVDFRNMEGRTWSGHADTFEEAVVDGFLRANGIEI